MNVPAFSSHISETRDHGLSLCQSWLTRLGDDGMSPECFELCSIVTLDQLRVDDLHWSLIAAAMNPWASHLELMVFPGNCTDPVLKIETLLRGLESEGFSPLDFDWSVTDEEGDSAILISLFTESEARFALGKLMAN